jgi:adenosyl cobinamide kinase/adenosyl cobinamide phosphate guanylyltransferase
VLLECVTLWLSNLYVRESRTPVRRQQDVLLAAVRDLADASRGRDVVAVSNEVGSGIVPATRVGRRFRDLQGWANQILAAEAACVVLVVAGLPLALKGRVELTTGERLAVRVGHGLQVAPSRGVRFATP